jgi:hypothetical protein
MLVKVGDIIRLGSARKLASCERCPGSPPGDRSRCRLRRSHGVKPQPHPRWRTWLPRRGTKTRTGILTCKNSVELRGFETLALSMRTRSPASPDMADRNFIAARIQESNSSVCRCSRTSADDGSPPGSPDAAEWCWLRRIQVSAYADREQSLWSLYVLGFPAQCQQCSNDATVLRKTGCTEVVGQ